MFILGTLLSLLFLVVFCLWAYGRYQHRLVWKTTPEVRLERAYGTAQSRTAVLVFTGAFNGPEHTERMIKERWQSVGDTYVVDYCLLRFSIFHTMLAMYNRLKEAEQNEERYDRVFVVGHSLGGLISLHLLRHARRHSPDLADKLVLLPSDSPLYATHLRIPGGGMIPPKFVWVLRVIAPLLRFVHPGPLFNRLSPIIAKATFIPAPPEMREAGMDEDQFSRHMATLQRNKLSVVIEQIAAIAMQRQFSRFDFGDTQVVYLQCGDGSEPDMYNIRRGEALVDGHGTKLKDKAGMLRLAKRSTVQNNLDAPDKVILGDAARESWRELFPEMLHVYVGKNTMHVALVEGAHSWDAASKQAVSLIA